MCLPFRFTTCFILEPRENNASASTRTYTSHKQLVVNGCVCLKTMACVGSRGWRTGEVTPREARPEFQLSLEIRPRPQSHQLIWTARPDTWEENTPMSAAVAAGLQASLRIRVMYTVYSPAWTLWVFFFSGFDFQSMITLRQTSIHPPSINCSIIGKATEFCLNASCNNVPHFTCTITVYTLRSQTICHWVNSCSLK